ncbi:MAG: universal stress protein [Magnetospirillum sp.]|nr:MAG: universal stress protein [Magnetospirillum sp.]
MGANGLSPTGRFKTILVCTDGSEFSDGAVRIAIAMAKKAEARLLAVSVVITNYVYEEVAPAAAMEAEEKVYAILEEVVARAAADGVACQPLVRRAIDPFEAIVAAAEDENADVIVAGRRGKRGLARFMLGDATAKIIGNAKCSVLVVPKAAQMWQNRLLLATDGSRSSDAAAVAGIRIAFCCHIPATVLSVEVPKHSPERQAEAARIVERAVAAYTAEGVEVEGVVARGMPTEVVVETAGKSGADIIVMGSHGRTGLGRLLVGSNSLGVIGKVNCPVLVVKGF